LTTAYPDLTVSGGRGARITLTYAEALYDAKGQKGNRSEILGKTMDRRLIHDRFLSDGGDRRVFGPLWWRTWRFLQVDIQTGDQPLRLESLRANFTAYPFEQKAAFHANDPTLAKIWEVGWRTARLDAHETYMDCPYWEQPQYIGDTRIEALVSYVVSGNDRLARQALRAFRDSFSSSGFTSSRYPTRQPQTIPPFSLLWIGMLHDFWWYRPDSGSIVRDALPVSRAVLETFSALQREDGLFRRLPEKGYQLWNFVDWTNTGYAIGVPPQDPDGGSVPISLQFVGALRDAADLEEATGRPDLAERYRANALRVVKTIDRRAWDGRRGLLADTPAKTSFSQQTNVLGILYDVIPTPDQPAVVARMVADELAGKDPYSPAASIIPASYYFRFYLARAIDHAGHAELYPRLLGPWRHMLSLGLSTWAEKPVPSRSDAHAWSSHPTYDLLTLMAGIKPDAPGFQRIRIAPHFGSLDEMDAVMPHPRGIIHVLIIAFWADLPPGSTFRREPTACWNGAAEQCCSTEARKRQCWRGRLESIAAKGFQPHG
jgi:alpha-L-rhamnosidase